MGAFPPAKNWAHKSSVRVPAIAFAAVATVAIIAWKWIFPVPLLGLSGTFDLFVVALFWVFLLWFLGLLRDPTSVPPRTKTLDNIDWHLDSVRSAGLPDERAANVGAAFLSWLVTRDHLSVGSLVGSDEAIAEYRAGKARATVLYEDFGGKLPTFLLTSDVVDFAQHYLDPRGGEFFDDLEVVLGPDPFRVEVTQKHLDVLHATIDKRLREWNEAA